MTIRAFNPDATTSPPPPASTAASLALFPPATEQHTQWENVAPHRHLLLRPAHQRPPTNRAATASTFKPDHKSEIATEALATIHERSGGGFDGVTEVYLEARFYLYGRDFGGSEPPPKPQTLLTTSFDNYQNINHPKAGGTLLTRPSQENNSTNVPPGHRRK